MSARRQKNIFQTRDERFNYRFGNPASRKRYRVRSKRRLIIAICVLLALLFAAGAVIYQFFLKDRDQTQTAPSADTTTEQQTAAQEEPQDTAAEEPDSSQETETPAASENAPFAVTAVQETEKGLPDEEGAAPKALLATPHDKVTKLVKKRRSDWRLVLVNPWHLIPDGFNVETITLLNGMEIDARAADDLDAMIDDCFNAGCYPDIASAYRSHDYQMMLFEEEQNNWINEGYSEEEAYEKAAEAIAIPGTSEHECGLAVDIVDAEYQQTDENQEDTPTQKWLLEHSWEYGFILRYPENKSEITGIKYEPWHYRYVGKKYAKQMHKNDLCLEEFVWMTDHPEDTTAGTSE